LVRGFKDRDGKFHPIGQSGGVRKSRQTSKVRYSNGSGSAQILEKQNRDFANKIKDRYNQFKANQLENFNDEIAMRRKFRGRLIIAYRQAIRQKIKSGRDLEKFIRGKIPDLPQEKGINKFVTKVLREFKKQEESLEKDKRGKSKEEKEALDTLFEDSLKESEAQFRIVQTDQDTKFRDEVDKRDAKHKKEIEKLEQKAKDAEDSLRQRDKDKADADKKEKEGASQEEQKKADDKAQESEKQAEQEQKEETTFADEVADELKKDQQEAKTEDFSFGFPSEIV